MEHKLANIRIAFDFLSVLKLGHHSKFRAKKNEHGEGDNIHPNVHSISTK